MIKVCILNKSNDVSRFNIFKKYFECGERDRERSVYTMAMYTICIDRHLQLLEC